MQAELKTKEKGTEEQFEEFFIEEVQTVKEIERIVILQLQKDLETKLIQEIQKKLQLKQLENKIIEEETAKKIEEETEKQEEILHRYSIEFETFYSKEGAYQIKSAYEKEQ